MGVKSETSAPLILVSANVCMCTIVYVYLYMPTLTSISIYIYIVYVRLRTENLYLSKDLEAQRQHAKEASGLGIISLCISE